MNNIQIKNIFAAVFEKGVLDKFLEELAKVGPSSIPRSDLNFFGTEGTVNYLKKKGFKAKSIISGFDFDGRVKSLDRKNFVRILADRSNKKHLLELKKELREGPTPKTAASRLDLESEPFGLVMPKGPTLRELSQGRTLRKERSDSESSKGPDLEYAPFDLVIVDLYTPDKKDFPESMDIGGQALIRAAIKNYKNVALAFDEKSTRDLTLEISKNNGSTSLSFRKKQAKLGLEFIAERGKLEANML
jgi:AICAR transformylase/IMP cyclohydrolase PurH